MTDKIQKLLEEAIILLNEEIVVIETPWWKKAACFIKKVWNTKTSTSRPVKSVKSDKKSGTITDTIKLDN